ncbi:uncharacterized protein LOC131650794 [Vicia villosa]|uniref:uncharacterized protein LOC131650794 n=1 Tax=Vicia villosa TaxID=3911 RepID=UPI00273AEE2A|nr:uncharacterized protein LOC131650794 [Vicia villosa]
MLRYMQRQEKCHVVAEENQDIEDSESFEDSLNGIHFEDSKEERMHDFNEVIGQVNDGVGAGTGQVNDGVGAGTGQVNGGVGAGTSQGIKKGLITAEMDKEHVIDDGYMTDDIDSGAYDDSADERPPVIRFNEGEKLRKKFSFKVGMEFASLKQFKKAVLEHNVLNGREVKFAKNDLTRCRVVCKDKKKCDYTVLCSRVLRTTTFGIKSLYAKHKYGRKFFNKNANAD